VYTWLVRDDNRTPNILFQLPVTTYQAYNFWGGKSLYKWGSGSIEKWGSKMGKRAAKVSFLRPYIGSPNTKAAYGVGAGEFLCNIQPINTHKYPISSAGWDYNMVRWLEKNGYDVAYITNLDTHKNTPQLQKTKLFMVHGHDEYWSGAMRKNVEDRRDKGKPIAFFSSNTMFWQIRIEASQKTAFEDSTMVCYKDHNLDPIKDKNCTVHFRKFPIENSEASLVGVAHIMDPVDGDITISNAEHWVFADTKLKNGDTLPGLLGYEIDRVTKSSPASIEILTSSSAKNLLMNNVGYAFWRKSTFYNRKVSRLASLLGLPSTVGSTALWILFYIGLAFGLFLFAQWNIAVGIGAVLLLLFLFCYALIKEVRKVNNSITTRGESNMAIYTASSGARVFSTGSMQWSWGLDDFNSPKLRSSRVDSRAETITKNVLNELTATTEA